MGRAPRGAGAARRPEVSRRLFGGILEFDAAGHYPGVELLNFVYCGPEEDGLLPAPAIPARIKRRSHDFARRLGWEKDFELTPRCSSVIVDGPDRAKALRAVLRCLQLPIPNSKKEPRWERVHLFPYTKSLIHWDARSARRGSRNSESQKVSIERTYLRGGGALSYRVLRSDPDAQRLARLRQGFGQLFKVTDETPLERIANAMLELGHSDDDYGADSIESLSESRPDDFENIYRSGMQSILEHDDVTSPARVRALIGWTSMWLLLMQHRRAAEYLELGVRLVVCDCGAGHAQLRRTAQLSLKDAQAVIDEALAKVAPEMTPRARAPIKSFFTASAATAGLLNAWTGRRHFTLSEPLLETLVLALVPKGQEVTFETFLHDRLYATLGLIVGRTGAESANLLSTIDSSIFEANENKLAERMLAAGLLTQYSDATRMISSRGLA